MQTLNKFFSIILIGATLISCNNLDGDGRNDVQSLNDFSFFSEQKEVNNGDKIYPSELINEDFTYIDYSEIGFSRIESYITLLPDGKWIARDGSWTDYNKRKWYVEKSSNSLVLLYKNRKAHVFELNDGIWCSKYGCLLTYEEYNKYLN